MSVVDTNGEWPGVLWRQKPILRVMHARIPTCRLISLGHATQTASRANSIFQNTNTNLETRLVLKGAIGGVPLFVRRPGKIK